MNKLILNPSSANLKTPMNGCDKNLIMIKRLIRGAYAFIRILKSVKASKFSLTSLKLKFYF
ncbi:hypothetical protein HpHA137_08240 [Helicobacter pylori]